MGFARPAQAARHYRLALARLNQPRRLLLEPSVNRTRFGFAIFAITSPWNSLSKDTFCGSKVKFPLTIEPAAG
jgi:hypothetical protein